MQNNKPKVPKKSFILQFYVLIISFIFPILTYKTLQIYKPSNNSLKSFFIGNLTFFIFALVLEQFLHLLVITLFPKLKDNIILFGIYGGIAAGLFEETGRLFSFSYFLNSQEIRNNNINSVYYGIGHGGIEIWMIVTLTYVNNIIISLKYNNGTLEEYLEKVDEEKKNTIITQFDTLINLDMLTCFACIYERIISMIFHIGNSIIVWYGIKNKTILPMTLLSIFNHTLVNSVTVILSFKLKKTSIPLMIQYFIIYSNLTIITSYNTIFALYFSNKTKYVLEAINYIKSNIKGDL
jgi:uncharacterized membrane protein YhfC